MIDPRATFSPEAAMSAHPLVAGLLRIRIFVGRIFKWDAGTQQNGNDL